jgi:hypothetical protein
MKKQLLYLIPLALLALNLTSLALYKDTVGFSGKAPVLQSLAPASWKLLNFDASLSASGQSTTSGTAVSTNPPLSSGASYKGFPFGAYFKKSSSTTSSSSSSSSDVSAWSWLWVTVDALILIIVFAKVAWLTRRPAKISPVTTPSTPNPVSTQPPIQAFAPAQPAAPNPAPAPFVHPYMPQPTTVAPTPPTAPAPQPEAPTQTPPPPETV